MTGTHSKSHCFSKLHKNAWERIRLNVQSIASISNSAPTRQHKVEMGKFRCVVTFFKIETGCTKRHFAEKQETKTERLRGQWKLKERIAETVNLI